MKILVISNCPLVYHQGSGYIILNHCHGLRDLGHEVRSFGPEDYEPFPKMSRARTYKIALGMFWMSLKQLRKDHYDLVVYYGGEAWLSLFFFKKLFKSRTPMIINSNGFETRALQVMKDFFGDISAGKGNLKWFSTDPTRLYDKAFHWADGIVTYNRQDQRYGLEKNYARQKIEYIEVGIEEAFLSVEPTFANTKTIGFCGTWIRRKGTDFIVDVINRTLTEFNDYRFVLIGVGDRFKKEEVFANEVCDRVHVYAAINSKSELIEAYKGISIFLFPSVYESFGLVMAEAMACGSALVAFDTGYASGLNEEEAIVIKEFTKANTYDAVKRLVENENLRRRLAMNGSKKVRNLRWKENVKKIEAVYAQWSKKS